MMLAFGLLLLSPAPLASADTTRVINTMSTVGNQFVFMSTPNYPTGLRRQVDFILYPFDVAPGRMDLPLARIRFRAMTRDFYLGSKGCSTLAMALFRSPLGTIYSMEPKDFVGRLSPRTFNLTKPGVLETINVTVPSGSTYMLRSGYRHFLAIVGIAGEDWKYESGPVPNNTETWSAYTVPNGQRYTYFTPPADTPAAVLGSDDFWDLAAYYASQPQAPAPQPQAPEAPEAQP
ncbi:hypothetical protein HYH03_014357 [Edaphochlamys debaryana]|uniref:Uncharacterized protein n=1 Tax=Edaphochlamys debaryana TaxID=47281 RepID=A0A836BS87_9CHLO|nr:hypothetical protein HYH03_014357 [Edaphochlamys debaryana]|eukprot:KAG2486985.1 hypothetical protein HYH03_014357 [Edaphochlamys debaryana]